MTEQPRAEVDRFAEALHNTLKETYRGLTKPKDLLITWLWVMCCILGLLSTIEGIYIWSTT